MPHFDIVKQNTPELTFRVSKIQADFDIQFEHSNEKFVGDIDFPDKWRIGAILGNSGTGKSTIAKQVFGNCYVDKYEYIHKSVIDDMPDVPMNEIEKMFYAVGFGSVPSWLKPYNVLSTGEKMRVDLARGLLEKDLICFDEFTSVVDRRVAETMCIAIKKAVETLNKQLVVVSCHYDVAEWLEPDWIFDTNTMTTNFYLAHALKKHSTSESVGVQNGKNLANIII